MLAQLGAPACAWAVAYAVLSLACADSALARKSPRAANAMMLASAHDIPIPKFSSPAPEASATFPQSPVRFFTINMALAKQESSRPKDTSLRLASVSAPDYLADGSEPMATAPERSDEPFGMQSFRAPEGLLWIKWRALTKDMTNEDPILHACRDGSGTCTDLASKFWSFVTSAKQLDGRRQLERVNQLVNAAIAYTSDFALHGQADKWTSPLATLKLGRGDCEDYAILKHRVLVEAGVPARNLKIVLVRDTAVRIDHAVLAARAGNQWFILDNRKAGFYEEHELPHYMPLFALDQNGVNLMAAPFASLQGGLAADEVLPGMDDQPVAYVAMDNTSPPLL
jgi:predicted transglutaminase-like cysteine proteinase